MPISPKTSNHLSHDFEDLIVDSRLTSPGPSTPKLPQVDVSDHDIKLDDNINYIRSEQSKIDSTLNFLLNFNLPKRKPGRPKAGEENSPNVLIKVPDTVNDSFKSITNINDLHPGVLLDYLFKVNSLNKRILTTLDNLNEKYNKLSKQLDRDEDCRDIDNIHQQPEASVKEVLKSDSDLERRIDDLEQRTYSNHILCSGPLVTDLLQTHTNRTELNSKITDKIKSSFGNIKNVDVKAVSVLGSENKVIKVICSDTNKAEHGDANPREFIFQSF